MQETGVASNRLLTLLTACVSLGLLTHEGEHYGNAPASAAYLVREAPSYFGDYYRCQIDRQIYSQLEQLDAALQGEDVPLLFNPGAVSLTPGWLSDRLGETGFTDITVQDLLPGITKLILAKNLVERMNQHTLAPARAQQKNPVRSALCIISI